ncbi:MAG: RAMP superfamily CRISPR-associated protein [Chloroflexota bacterium]|nr:RAMP superfamily CRISPR-associated protein [Chloroflexota bacterium]
MNPYDFARIDWERPPERRKPTWHHQLVGSEARHLYSGHIDVDVFAETPIFVSDPRNVPSDPKKPAQFMQNKHSEYVIPGSSLKGMLRSVVETLGNGCLTLFDGDYERGQVNYRRDVPQSFQHCSANTNLCLACRTFGMLKEREGGVFLGKVNIGDAVSYSDTVSKYKPMYTALLMEPKPHHEAFYLDEERKHIAGRKFYFHHSRDLPPLDEPGMKFFGGRPANRFIQPLDYDTRFHFRVDFSGLEADEFGALLLAIALEENEQTKMRHKIGYGKPSGLGSVYLQPTALTLVDYATRYTRPAAERGITEYQGDAMWNLLYDHIDNFTDKYLVAIAMDDLRRIWRWPPEPGVEYAYPSKRDWFDTSEGRGKRIRDTRNLR